MERELTKPLLQAIDFLEKNKLTYAVVGGIAVAQWGFVRATYDVDIKVMVPNSDYEGTASLFRKKFPEKARVNLPPNPLIVSVLIHDVIIDFLLAIPGYEENIIKRAIQREIGGKKIQICSAEDLIVQKTIAGRSKDWLDIENILMEQNKNLDFDYIEDWLSQFSEALENPAILKEYLQLKQKTINLGG